MIKFNTTFLNNYYFDTPIFLFIKKKSLKLCIDENAE